MKLSIHLPVNFIFGHFAVYVQECYTGGDVRMIQSSLCIFSICSAFERAEALK